MKTVEKGIICAFDKTCFFCNKKTHQVSITVGLDKRVVIELVVNVALDCPGVSFHLQKQHILIIFKSFAAQSFGPLGLLQSSLFGFTAYLDPVDASPSTPSWKAVRVKGPAPTS